MKYNILAVILFLIIVGFSLTPFSNVTAQDARQLVEESFDYVRGKASIATVDMTIHRPGWQRQMRIKAWTRGQKDSLFYIDAPAKDHGNGTLKKGRQMWLFNPKWALIFPIMIWPKATVCCRIIPIQLSQPRPMTV
jgi:hypothetical protein